MIPVALLPTMTGAAAKVFLALKLHKNGGPVDAPLRLPLVRLVEATGMASPAVVTARRQLESLKLVRMEGTDIYRLLSPAVPWVPPAGVQILKRGHARGMQSTPDIINLVMLALRTLGIAAKITSSYSLAARRSASKRLQEGHSAEELAAVVAWAHRLRAAGDRWPQWQNVLYLWGRQLPSHLAAMSAIGAAPDTLVFRSGEHRAAFDDDAGAAAQRPLPALS